MGWQPLSCQLVKPVWYMPCLLANAGQAQGSCTGQCTSRCLPSASEPAGVRSSRRSYVCQLALLVLGSAGPVGWLAGGNFAGLDQHLHCCWH